MKAYWRLVLIICLLAFLCSCIPDGCVLPSGLFTPGTGQETRMAESETAKAPSHTTRHGSSDRAQAVEEPYYMPAQDIRDAVLHVLEHREVPYREGKDTESIEAGPVVPSQVQGWAQKMSSGDCETVFIIRIQALSSMKTRLQVEVLFPPSAFNQSKKCDPSAQFLEERFLDEVHEALMREVRIARHPQQPALDPQKRMTVSVTTANVRSGPGTDNRVIARLGHGTPVDVQSQKGEWIQVVMETGQEGWVHQNLLEPAVTEALEEKPGSVPEPTIEKTLPEAPTDPPPHTGRAEAAPPQPEESALPPAPPAETLQEERSEVVERLEPEDKRAETEEAPEQGTAFPPGPLDQASDDAMAPEGLGPQEPEEEADALTATMPAPVEPGPALVIREGPPVDVFRDPNVFSPKIGKINGGIQIPSFEKRGNFFKISHGQMEGYVYKDFCTIHE